MLPARVLREIDRLIVLYEVPVSIIGTDGGGRHRKVILRRNRDGAQYAFPVTKNFATGVSRDALNWITDVRRWSRRDEKTPAFR